MVHNPENFWKWHCPLVKWPLMKWPFGSISHSFISNILLTGSLIGALIYLYKTSRRLPRAASRSTTNGSVYGVPAMLNLGNTCYANSLLQGLASSKAFLKWITAVNTRLSCENHKLMFLDALIRIIKDLNDTTVDTCSASDVIDALLAHRWSIPSNTEQDLYELFNVFVTTWDEELVTLRQSRCSPLQKIVEVGNEDKKILLNQVNSANIIRRNVVGPVLSADDMENVQDQASTSSSSLNSTCFSNPLSRGTLSFENVKSVVADEKLLKAPCMGLLAVQLRCCREGCAYKKIREEKFCVLSLSLPRSPNQFLTLSKLLQRFFAAEYIQGASCDRCVERKRDPSGGLMKKQGLCKLPSLLIFRIERVGFSQGGFVFKRTERFFFPEFIDVREYCFFADEKDRPKPLKGSLTNSYFRVLGGSASNAISSSTPSITAQQQQAEQTSANGDATSFCDYENLFKYKYQLRAVSVHMGQAHSGHFITYRRGIGPQNRTTWYRTSDTEVTPVSFTEVASSEAYMLFYDRTLATLK